MAKQQGQISPETYGRLLSEKERYRTTLVAIRDHDSFQGGPIAPRPTPTEDALRAMARDALERFGE